MGKAAVPPPVTQVLEAAGGWLSGALARVEERLAAALAAYDGPAAEHGSSTLGSGGKRIRPMLVMLCAGPEAGDEAVGAAVAVELVHTATLIHDDVLDNAPLRRGEPTVFAISGRDGATATGDLLFARAFAELAAGRSPDAIRRLSDAAVALAHGELMQREDSWDLTTSEERYRERCRMKTARLFEAACALGAEADPSGTPTAIGAMERFGGRLGLAFQMLDDVLDVEGPPERTGKARGTDLLDGTVNLPLILAMRRDRELAAIELRGLDAATATAICDRIAATGALVDVRAEAIAQVERARAEIAALELAPQRKDLLATVAQGVVDRYS
jgi:geranylgeranyl pyrophosphate synthase